ncbi:MAG: hypothetical protein PHW69_00760 [Elusimicrobiaceae bacterium]|nr:hypothetical protein [Elusimicrobiaceae bacterium]
MTNINLSSYPAAVKFGTSGWRAPIADGFTAFNLQRLTQALLSHIIENPEYGFQGDQYRRHLKEKGLKHKKPLVIVGYDTRFMSEQFARLVADVLASNAVSVKLAQNPAPVPAVAFAVVKYGAVGGVTITASEGRHFLSGFKWTPFWGGPAIPEVTEDIEKRLHGTISSVNRAGLHEFAFNSPLVEPVDISECYLQHIETLIDFKRIKKAGLKICVDPLFGSAISYLRPLLERAGLKPDGIHEYRDVLFGGKPPYTGPDSLADLSKRVTGNRLDIGVACDCDGDRFGIIDSDGNWISPNEVLALALDHLVRNRGMKGRVCRSVVTSHFVDAVARSHGLEIRETPVGFKFVGELMRTGNYIIGGEESGGFSILGHVPEKDGMLACMLIIEMLAYDKKPLKKIRQDLHKRLGEFFSVKTSMPIMDDMERMIERLTLKPPLALAGFSVWRIDQTDGFKFILRDGSWLGLRPSGTEPMVRIYAEATGQKKLDQLVQAGKEIIKGKF